MPSDCNIWSSYIRSMSAISLILNWKSPCRYPFANANNTRVAYYHELWTVRSTSIPWYENLISNASPLATFHDTFRGTFLIRSSNGNLSIGQYFLPDECFDWLDLVLPDEWLDWLDLVSDDRLDWLDNAEKALYSYRSTILQVLSSSCIVLFKYSDLRWRALNRAESSSARASPMPLTASCLSYHKLVRCRCSTGCLFWRNMFPWKGSMRIHIRKKCLGGIIWNTVFKPSRGYDSIGQVWVSAQILPNTLPLLSIILRFILPILTHTYPKRW